MYDIAYAHTLLLLKKFSTIIAVYYTVCSESLSVKAPAWQNYPELYELSAKKKKKCYNAFGPFKPLLCVSLRPLLY